MSDSNRREIYSLLRFITDKKTKIRNTLGSMRGTNSKKYEKNDVNQDLKE